MSFNLRTGAASVLLAMACGLVVAEPVVAPPSAAAASGSLAPRSAAFSYRSVFDGYRSYSEQAVISWRAANDQVGQIGGWQAYAREGQGGAPASGASTPAASASSVAAPVASGRPKP